MDREQAECVQQLLGGPDPRSSELRQRLDALQSDRVRLVGQDILDSRVETFEEPLRTLLELFFLCQELDLVRTTAALGESEFAALLGAGLVTTGPRVVAPTVRLSTIDDRLVASDLDALHTTGNEEFVSPPIGPTRLLASLIVPVSVRSALDLGCGSGALALSAATRAERVVATDVSSRAVAFCRFNADLNGERLDVRAGDLYSALDGERFDLIVSNPPYVLSPEQRYLYRDGDTGLTRRIVDEAHRHLRAGGWLEMMLEWPQGADQDWRLLVSQWLEATPCDAWLLRFYRLDAREHAAHWLGQQYGSGRIPDEQTERWLEHLARLGADSVGGGLLVLRPSDRAEPIRTLRESPPRSRQGAGRSLAAWVDAQRLAADVASPEALLDLCLRPATGLRSVIRATPGGDGWQQQDRVLQVDQGLRFRARVDRVAEEIIGLLDGERTPRQAMEQLAEHHGLEARHFIPGLPPALIELLRLGILVPPDSAEEAR